MEIVHLFISPGHNFRGGPYVEPGNFPTLELAEVQCVAGRGIRGDRYFDHKSDYKGQITFFEEETYQSLCDKFGVTDRAASAFRRNVITRGINLNSLIGTEIQTQGVRFLGVEERKPCHWMNTAFCPGAEQAMLGHGGLRAKILTDGILRVGQWQRY
jgi:MOSC domain-containing protein YiiM